MFNASVAACSESLLEQKLGFEYRQRPTKVTFDRESVCDRWFGRRVVAPKTAKRSQKPYPARLDENRTAGVHVRANALDTSEHEVEVAHILSSEKNVPTTSVAVA